eukprot:tig00020848_g14530.t1
MDSRHFDDAPRRRSATNTLLQELTDVAAVTSNASAEREALNALSNTERPILIDCGGGICITSPGNPLTPQGVAAWRDDAQRAIDRDTKRYSDADDGSKLALAGATLAAKALPSQYQASIHDMINQTGQLTRDLAKAKEEHRDAADAVTDHVWEKGPDVADRSRDTRNTRQRLLTKRDTIKRTIRNITYQLESDHCIRGLPSLVRWVAINITEQERFRTQTVLLQAYNGYPLPEMVSTVAKILSFVGAGLVCKLEGQPTPMEVYDVIKKMIAARDLESGRYPLGDYQLAKMDNFKQARRAAKEVKDLAMKHQPPAALLNDVQACNAAVANFLLEVPWLLRTFPWKDVSRRSTTVAPPASVVKGRTPPQTRPPTSLVLPSGIHPF